MKTEITRITIRQKTEILLLLNNSTITSEEKKKMIEKLCTFDITRAYKAIERLKKTIRERTENSRMAA